MSVLEWIKLLGPWLLELARLIFSAPKQAGQNVKESRSEKE